MTKNIKEVGTSLLFKLNEWVLRLHIMIYTLVNQSLKLTNTKIAIHVKCYMLWKLNKETWILRHRVIIRCILKHKVPHILTGVDLLCSTLGTYDAEVKYQCCKQILWIWVWKKITVILEPFCQWNKISKCL